MHNILLLVLVLAPLLAHFLYSKNEKLIDNIALSLAFILFPVSMIGVAYSQQSVQALLFEVPVFLGAIEPLYMGFHLDVMNALLIATVQIIGLVVYKFSYRYLLDDSQRQLFLKQVSFVLTTVSVFMSSLNLLQMVLSWMLTSYFLHGLLTHFKNRRGALEAANHKFWISRIGDLFLILAVVLTAISFSSLNFQTIFETAKNQLFDHEQLNSIYFITILIVVGAMTKSAQFPFHGWLPNTMETPTPVSALMHAGIINAGGFLIIKMSPLLALTPLVSVGLVVVGGVTAFLGAASMLTQVSLKKSLAYSTISQMGFMMIQCGVGAYALAVLHIVGHAFYKSYEFLSNGTVYEKAFFAKRFSSLNVENPLWAPFLTLIILGCFILPVIIYVGQMPEFFTAKSQLLLFILFLAVSQIILSSKFKWLSSVQAVFVTLVYFVLGSAIETLLVGSVGSAKTHLEISEIVALVFVSTLFLMLYFIQNYSEYLNKTRIGQKMYVYFYNGFKAI